MDASGKLGSVLIVESDQGMQNLIGIYLRKAGARPVVIETWDAKAQEEIRLGQFDLAIIDWKTKIHPSLDLYKLLRVIPASTKMPIIFISGQITRNDIAKTSHDPLTKFVIKPFTEELLFKAIRELSKKTFEVRAQGKSQIRIHKGDKPQGLASAQIITGEKASKATLDLYQGGGAHAMNASMTELSSGDMISDIDLDEDKKIEDKSQEKDPSLSYAKKSRADASTFDYRLMQKLSNHGKEKGEAAIDVLVIDDDQALTTLVQNHLSEVKTDYVEVCGNAVDGWNSIQKYNYQLIIMDWRCKGLSGLCLYNRIRSRPESQKTPILILTGGIERDNFKMIEDKKCTLVLEKPFELKVFEKAVDSIRRLESSDLKMVELVVRTIDGCEGDKKKILSQIIAVGAKVPSKFDFYLASGQYLIHQGDYPLALKVLEGASKLDPENVTVMTELAKVYLRLNRPTDSLKLLDIANQFSPGNIQRLCLMGEAGLDLFDTDKARAYFNDALEIDSENLSARRGATLADNLASFSATQTFKPLKEQFASTLNLIGITLIKNGQIEKGIEQYHCAMAFIHDGPTLAKLQFNLGLAYHRHGNKSMAIEWLEEALKNANNLFPKASQWIVRIREELTKKPGRGIVAPEVPSIDWDSPDILDSLADSLQKLMMEEDESV